MQLRLPLRIRSAPARTVTIRLFVMAVTAATLRSRHITSTISFLLFPSWPRHPCRGLFLGEHGNKVSPEAASSDLGEHHHTAGPAFEHAKLGCGVGRDDANERHRRQARRARRRALYFGYRGWGEHPVLLTRRGTARRLRYLASCLACAAGTLAAGALAAGALISRLKSSTARLSRSFACA
jgi:hypothetical protein